jgi:hypothetical protein
MRTYVKLYFSSEGAGPLDLVEQMQGIGFRAEVGEYDFSVEWKTPEQYGTVVRRMHSLLAGSRVRYTLMTKN